jgi:hypothetical protein
LTSASRAEPGGEGERADAGERERGVLEEEEEEIANGRTLNKRGRKGLENNDFGGDVEGLGGAVGATCR